jgi:putative FmdB family regulatory protein
MPIYEYRCLGCGRRLSVLVARIGADPAACPRCGASRLERLWSRFATARSEEDRLERLADPAALSGLDENDPKSMAQFMRRMGRELGEDAGPEFEEALSELEQAPPGALTGADAETGAEPSGESSEESSPPA